MKIGILTFHRPSNFGANLQAFSSYKYLESLGHEVKLLDYVRKVDFDYQNLVNSKQYLAHNIFVEENLPLTKQANNEEELINICEEEHFDMLVIGADAVWRCPDDGGIYFATWLFKNPKLRSTMKVSSLSAAHMGSGFMKLSLDERNNLKRSLQSFTYISVRDSWTKDKINQDIFGGTEFVTTINYDPVFMLSNFVNGIKWNNYGIESKSYILMTLPKNWLCSDLRYKYFRRRWFRRFKMLVNKAGLQLVELPIPEGKSGLNFDYCVDYPIDPIQWFLWIKNAKGFVGLRFHAIVSCISNTTPFFSIDSYGEYSSTTSFWDYFGFHKKARTYDKRSKIRNLLKGTPFENNRTGRNPESENPKTILSLLLDCSEETLVKMRDKCQSEFRKNVVNMLSIENNE